MVTLRPLQGAKQYTRGLATKLLKHPWEVCAHVCDAITIVGVVVLQDVYLVEATILCLVASICCFGFNWVGYRQGTRKVKSGTDCCTSVEGQYPLRAIVA